MKKGLLVSFATALVATSAVAAADTTSTTTTTAATTSPSYSTPTSRDTVTLYEYNRPNKAWLFTGGLVFLGSYVPTAVITATNDLDRSLYIPVVGPWLHLADQPQDASTRDTILVAGSGALQGLGVLMMTASLFIPEKVPTATIHAGNTKIHLGPTSMGRTSAGIGAVGTF